MYNYELTKYPQYFHYTYWGCFEVYNNEEDIEILCENRNKFIEENNIIKHRENIPDYIKNETLYYRGANIRASKKDRDMFYQDHMEYYETEEEYIVIFSNYTPYEEYKDIALKNGFKLLPYNLYTIGNSKTMIKKVLKRKNIAKQ